MVSKVAVIALVAIVACPILLGYAFNLDEVSVTEYKETDDRVNVTPLISSGTEYSYTYASAVDLNTRFYINDIPGYPDYESYTYTSTAVPMNRIVYNTVPNALYTLADFNILNVKFDYNFNVGYANMVITFNDNTTKIIQSVHDVYYDSDNQVLYYAYYEYLNNVWVFSNDSENDVKSINFTVVATYSGTVEFMYLYDGIAPITYVDLSKGYFINYAPSGYSIGEAYNSTVIELPNYTRSVLMTIDLSTITASNYTFDLEDSYSNRAYRFYKITDLSGVHWLVGMAPINGTFTQIADLYYNPSVLSNTYQVTLTNTGITFDYVGNWPTVIGKANVYWSFNFEYTYNYSNNLALAFTNGQSPLMRLDSAEYRAFEYSVISNYTYNPADFKSNPSTEISSITKYGSRIVFGGNNYNVTDGSISINGHKVPLQNIKLQSVSTDAGYENRINGTVVSTTASPSTIQFVGSWGANVITSSMELNTYTKTEWTPGQFGWDGIDSNFLMVGLITSVGMFIAAVIYARLSGKRGLFPLIIVTGCAAILFFVML